MTENRQPRPAEDLLVAAVEAVLFAAGEPVPVRELAAALGGAEESDVEQAVEALVAEYRRRGAGLRVERVAGGLRLATCADVGPWVRQYFRQRNRTRLSPAALETLAIVAYRQPATAPEIQAIRGVDSSASLKSLLEKKLIRILGRKKVVGSPLLYGTSRHFLVHFGLNRLEDLPPIEDFKDLLGSMEDPGAPVSAPLPATLGEGPEVRAAVEEGDGELPDLSEEE